MVCCFVVKITVDRQKRRKADADDEAGPPGRVHASLLLWRRGSIFMLDAHCRLLDAPARQGR
jgi:hypothetical protein